jgi:hypothetical protein
MDPVTARTITFPDRESLTVQDMLEDIKVSGPYPGPY